MEEAATVPGGEEESEAATVPGGEEESEAATVPGGEGDAGEVEDAKAVRYLSM